MVEIGKRSRSQNDNVDGRNYKRRTERDDKSRDELVVYRILCPDNVIGSVIGKSGKVINSIRQETRAKVKVVDPFPGAKDRVITIYCYVKEKEEIEVDGEFDDREPLCAAQEALLKVHAAIANAVSTARDSNKNRNDKDECQLLVPSSQAANIIGKSGSTIKKLRSKTGANIRVMAKDASDATHSCAMDFDNFALISGNCNAVEKVLFAVSTIMYKFTPKEDIPLDTSVTEGLPSIIFPADVPLYSAHGVYPSVDQVISSRGLASVLGPAHVPDLSGYGDAGSRFPAYPSVHPDVSGYGRTIHSEELIIKVLCPSKKIGRVIGKGGASIKSVRQASGARVEVDDAKADRDERVFTIIAEESAEDMKSMAVEAVLLLQGKINDEDDDTVNFRLLIPSRVIGCIIGRSGSIINEIRKRTRADIRISKSDKPRCADDDDELVEVSGEVGNVRDALVQIVLRLREHCLKDNGSVRNPSAVADPLHSTGSGIAVPSVPSNVSSMTPMSYEPIAESGSRMGLHPSSSIYRYGSVSDSLNFNQTDVPCFSDFFMFLKDGGRRL
ncbi:hypothetical protein Leryth_012446 [Lithospermum erythrorhizon]|nr:hypothetical protein Leryth_012446 [Lithospermum erythrorhizon]